IAFLYSGPAINVLAIVLTARVLGLELGVARAVGAVLFSVVIGFLMHLVFLKQEKARAAQAPVKIGEEAPKRRLWQEVAFFAGLVGFLVFANWARGDGGIWSAIYAVKWPVAALSAAVVAFALWRWFSGGDIREWGWASWTFAKQIMPLLLGGVLVAGFLLGRPGYEGIIPAHYVTDLVGGNSFFANFFASIVGSFMYFATLTEVPILQGLIGSGMGKGPALALLLAGPALSLPNMLVIRSVLGTAKTAVYVLLVVVMATFSGLIFGALF
ncbi:MAG TPA: permease, partial [bacterium]|nr:permease [bacterium]